MATLDLIAFYGTLMQSGNTPIHPVIQEHLTYQGECILAGRLYDLGDYPGLKPGNRHIKGELYAVKDAVVLTLLDEYESSDPDPMWPGYTRKEVQLMKPAVKAWCYVYNGPVNEEKLIQSNVWSKF